MFIFIRVGVGGGWGVWEGRKPKNIVTNNNYLTLKATNLVMYIYENRKRSIVRAFHISVCDCALKENRMRTPMWSAPKGRPFRNQTGNQNQNAKRKHFVCVGVGGHWGHIFIFFFWDKGRACGRSFDTLSRDVSKRQRGSQYIDQHVAHNENQKRETRTTTQPRWPSMSYPMLRIYGVQ